jgi:hypothetical protein
MKKIFFLFFLLAQICRAQFDFSPPGGTLNPVLPAASGGGITPVFDYYFNGNANDNTGNWNGTTVGSPGYATGQDGIANHAISLNGSSQYVTISTFNSLANASSFSMATWIKLSATGGTYTIARQGFNTAFDLTFFIRIASGVVSCQIVNSSGTAFAISGGTTLSSGTWYFCAFTYDGANLKLYVNGISDATPVSATGNIWNGTQGVMDIGARPASPADQFFPGVIDETQCYTNVVWSSTVISTLYSNGAK